MLTSEPRTWDGLEKYAHLMCLAWVRAHKHTAVASVVLRSQTIHARSRGVTQSIAGKMRRNGWVCRHRYGVLSGGGAHSHTHNTCSLTGQSLLKVWIKLWSQCRVNMKAFTVVKKSRLWLECDVWKCFLMPARADSGAFKSSRDDAGSLPSKICWIDGFTSTNSPWVLLLFFFFFSWIC